MTDRPVVVVTNWVHAEILGRLARSCEVVANQDRTPWPDDVLRAHAQRAAAIIAFMPDRIDAAFLRQAPKLRHVACALKGYDNFDIAACTEGGVVVSIVEDLLTAPSAELTLGLMIGLGRHLLAGDDLVRAAPFAGWRPQLYGLGLDGSVVGLVGLGAIGRAIAARLRGFGCRILCYDRAAPDGVAEAALGVERVDLYETLLPRSNYVVLCLPLNAETLGIVDARFLAAMRPGALLVNPARGSLVEEAAVAAALERGQLGGYAADVFACEDWARPDRPADILPALRAAPRTLFTPHLGSAVDVVRRRIAEAAVANVLAVLAGREPPGCLNWSARRPLG